LESVRMVGAQRTEGPKKKLIQELQWELPEHLPYSLELTPSDFHLFDPLKTTLVVNVSPMTKRLKRRCGSGWDNSEKDFSMLRVSPHW
jgi:hypothetical protein